MTQPRILSFSFLVRVLCAITFVALAFRPAAADENRLPLFRVAELNSGETAELEFANGLKARVRLLGVEETRDSLRRALRRAMVKIEVNGVEATIETGGYRLPIPVGDFQVDCPATAGVYWRHDRFEDSWGLDKEARLRIWPKNSPWAPPGEFGYPLKQRWFANATQSGNEPSYVMGEDAPTSREIYYHAGFDIGGVEGIDEVVCARDGLVISARGETLPNYPDLPFYQQSSYATVYVEDAIGWIHRYTHLKSVAPSLRLGERIKVGQPVGRLGIEEGAGYYAHLHYDIKSRQPSGKWGVQDAYAFLWEANLRQHNPPIVAVARPHAITWVGDPVTLDGGRSWCASGEIRDFEWTFGNGQVAHGKTVERRYDQPGRYSEILKVVDGQGNIDYDFAIVDVIERERGDAASPAIHAACNPTLDVRPGDPITFVVRTAFTTPTGETWDFGDGSPPARVRSDASRGGEDYSYAITTHAYSKPGVYLVRVEHVTESGAKVTARLVVRIEERRVTESEKKFDVIVSAGRVDRMWSPTRVVLPSGAALAKSARLVGPDGEMLPAQMTAPRLASDEGPELHFILPRLPAGESMKFQAILSDQPASGEEFTWRHNTGDFALLSFGEQPVLRYHHEAYDPSTPANLERTYKVFHHVFAPHENLLLTGGLSSDPNVHSVHHRGIFFGFNRIGYGAGKSADTWHCLRGAHQSHEGFSSEEAGPVMGRHRIKIAWHGEDGQAFAEEDREITAYYLPGSWLLEFASRLTAIGGPVRLDGDPQHAGLHFRADNEVYAKTSDQTIFVRPDGQGQPGETRNWDPSTQSGPVNLPWNAMSFILGSKRYAVEYLDHPGNPKEARQSEREYGRFGTYFERLIEPDRPLVVRYRFWIREGLPTLPELTARSDDFVEPVETTVTDKP